MYGVVLEVTGKPPVLVGEYSREADARECAVRVAHASYKATGEGKVSVLERRESQDSLQRYGTHGEKVKREHDTVPGEDLNVIVEPGRITTEEAEAWRRRLS